VNTAVILGILSALIIVAYTFDELAKKTKFPTVILLIIIGILGRTAVDLFTDIDVQSFDWLIPILGTIGLIMIVIEEAIRLEISKKSLSTLFKALFTSIVLLYTNIFLLSWVFQQFFRFDFPSAVIYSIPLSVLSSAVAVPSISGALKFDKSFFGYETTFSVIIGIATFYYSLNQFQEGKSPLETDEISSLLIVITIVLLASVLLTIVLIRVLKLIDHPSKFLLILAMIFGIYSIGTIQDYPILLILFIFGALLSNTKNLLPKRLKDKINIQNIEEGIQNFRVLSFGLGFLTRIFFSLFFGFSLLYSDFNSIWPFIYGIGLFVLLFIPRYLYFLIFKTLLFFGQTFRILTPSFQLSFAPIPNLATRILTCILLFIEINTIDSFTIDNQAVADEKSLFILILTSTVFLLTGRLNKNSKVSAEPQHLDDSGQPQVIHHEDMHSQQNEKEIDQDID